MNFAASSHGLLCMGGLRKTVNSIGSLKVCHPRCVRLIIQSSNVYIYIYIYIYMHTVMNATILQLVAIYNIQLHTGPNMLYIIYHY